MFKKNWMRLGALWIAFTTFSCAHPGPSVEVCILDPANNGFQCQTEDKSRFLTYGQGRLLQCASPQNVEVWFESCKKGQIDPLEFCELSDGNQKLKCYPPDGHMIYYKDINDGNNYVCLTEQNFTRIKSRCKQ